MKAVQVVSRGKAEFVDAPKPLVTAGHVVIRPTHLSLCGSDIQMLYHAPEQNYPFPPGTTGHEMVGIVEEIGDGDCVVQEGDRVLSLAPGHRALCEHYLAPFEHLVPLTDNLPLEVLLQAQQLGTVIYASKRLPSVAGQTVAVIGQGSAGLWFNFYLKKLGATKVIALDLEEFRLERSQVFGATDAFCNATEDAVVGLKQRLDGELAGLVVEAAGEVEAINLATRLVKKFGDILFFGYPRAQTFAFDFDQLYHQCCRATTIVGASDEPGLASMHEAVQLVASGEAPAEKLITHRLPFDRVIEAYEMHRTRADQAVKIVIEMPTAS